VPETAAAAAGCRLREITGWSVVQVAGWRDSLGGLEAALERACGTSPPGEVGGVARQGSLSLIRTGPGRLWVVDEGCQVEEKLAASIAPADGCLTPLSHGLRRWRLEGPRAQDVLAKMIALDLDAPALAPGRAAGPGLHHVPVLVHRLDAASFDLYLPRTFARGLIDLLADAALEFGSPS
jgi:sarcosine oxidase subunit gamma